MAASQHQPRCHGWQDTLTSFPIMIVPLIDKKDKRPHQSPAKREIGVGSLNNSSYSQPSDSRPHSRAPGSVQHSRGNGRAVQRKQKIEIENALVIYNHDVVEK